MPTQHTEEERPRKKKKHGVDAKTVAALEKVSKLVELAHENENTDEARNAALIAVNLMHEHQLCVIPRAEIERLKKHIEGTNALARDAKEQRMQNMLLGGALGMMLAKSGFLR